MIHQINMQFNPEEDRVLFKLSTVQKEEFRFWFTRRYVKLLWPILQRMIENDYKMRNPETSHLVKAMMPFERDTVLSRADFSSPYSEVTNRYPLGEAPILLSGINVKDGPVLCLLPSRGSGIEIKMDSRLLHSFTELLRNTSRAADWGLDFMPGGPKMEPQTGTTTRTLH